MTLILFGSLFLFLLLGVSVFVALGLPAVIVVLMDNSIPNLLIPQRIFFGLDRFALMAIPYFIFCAEIMGRGQIGKRLVAVSRAFFGHLPGGMAVAAVFACLMFGAIAGAGLAALIAFGALLHSLMRQGQYKDQFSAGLIATSSTLSQQIPPSIIMVTFATVTGVSAAQLFLAGLSAGILFALVLAVYCVVYSKVKKLPTLERIPMRERGKPLLLALPALGMMFVIFGGIYGGILSITEAAGVAAFYALLVELFIYRSIQLKDIYAIAIKASRTVAMIMILIATGGMIGWLVSMWQIPQMVVGLIGDVSPLVMLLIITVIFLIAGMVLEGTTAVVVLLPLLFPAAMAAGVNPVHMGTLVILNISIGMLTPPTGLNIFAGMSIFKLSYTQMLRGLIPFIILMLVYMLILILIPGLVTWLPNLAMR